MQSSFVCVMSTFAYILVVGHLRQFKYRLTEEMYMQRGDKITGFGVIIAIELPFTSSCVAWQETFMD